MTDNARLARDVIEQKLNQHVAIMDAGGETLGTVGQYDAGAGYFTVTGGDIVPDGTRFPLDAIGDTGASGIYLQGYKDDLAQQYGGDTGMAGSQTGGAAAMASGSTMTDNAMPSTGQVADTVTGQSAFSTGTVQGQSAFGTGTVQETNDLRVPVVEEQLVVGKREEELGRVRVHKDVVEEQQTVSVPLQREEVTVERVPVNDTVDPSTVDNAFTERDIAIPVMGEEAVVAKEAHVAEEVRLRKEVVTENEQVSGTVRREQVTVDGGDVGVGGDATTSTRTVDTAGGATTGGTMASTADAGSATRNASGGAGNALHNAADKVGDTVREGVDRLTDR